MIGYSVLQVLTELEHVCGKAALLSRRSAFDLLFQHSHARHHDILEFFCPASLGFAFLLQLLDLNLLQQIYFLVLVICFS